MPESQYFFGFWLFMLMFLRYLEKRALVRIVSLSLSLSYLMLIKPHAVFLIIPLFFYFFFDVVYRGNSFRCALTDFARTVGLSLIIRSVFGYFVGGTQGLAILGAYSNVATNPTLELFSLRSWTLILTSLQGHLLSLFFLFGSVSIFIYCEMKRKVFIDNLDQSYSGLLVFGFFAICTMLMISSVFTAEVVLIDSGQSLYRIHQRYYSFLFPFFILYAIKYIDSSHEFKDDKIIKYLLLPLVSIVTVFTVTQIPRIYKPNFIDSPAISSMALE